jgi:hypothetical protein
VCYLTEVLLLLVGILLAVTVGAAVEYYRQLRRVQKEYEEAKEVVEDIVLSFNRQLKREAERLEVVAYKVGAISSKGDRALKRAGEVEKQVHTLEPKIGLVLEDREKMLVNLGEINKKVRDAVASQKALTAQISDIEERTRQLSMVPEKGVEAVIPIRRERALAPLTETELSVLEILALEGPKTAPEIKDRIKLSREHTARLMKKVYGEGYVERDTTKIPFKYRIKKEMEKLLKKTESET